MGLSLLSPLALIGLLSLLLPLLLHLQRRVQRTPLRFAALRWLRPLQRPRRHWRLRRPWLLLLRLLLAGLLVLLLVDPVWRSERVGTGWVLVHPALDPTALDLREPAGAERRWWATGFPTLDQPAPTADQPLASLLRELDAGLSPGTTLQIWSPPVIDGLDGALLRLQGEVDWRVERQAQGAGAQGTGHRAEGDADVEARWLILQDTAAGSAGTVEGARWLTAAAAALATPDSSAATDASQPGAASTSIDLQQIAADAELTSDTLADVEALLWLQDTAWSAPVEAWLQAGGQLIWPAPCSDCAVSEGWFALWRSAEGSGTVLARRHGRGRLLRPDRALTPAHYPELLAGAFPHLLQSWLHEPEGAPARAPAVAMAPLAGAAAGPLAARTLDSWLLPLLALLVLSERILALWAPSRGDHANRSQPT